MGALYAALIGESCVRAAAKLLHGPNRLFSKNLRLSQVFGHFLCATMRSTF